MSASLMLLLVCVGLVAGVGITAVGPGGVIATAGLFLFTDLSPSAVAGTALISQMATGTFGSLAYLHPGHLRERQVRRIAFILLATAVPGAPLGVLLNSVLSGQVFGTLLAAFVALIAVLVWVRGRRIEEERLQTQHSTFMLASIGFLVAVASGMFGVGGPLLAVPLLAAIATPVDRRAHCHGIALRHWPQ